jgi:FkbM family methyltransferase
VSKPLRDALGRRLHAIVDRRIAEAGERPGAEYRVFGPPERLRMDPSAKVHDALFNTVSGTITIEAGAFFGHGVAVLTGTHDIRVRGAARQEAYPREGRDVVIGAGAWVSSRAIVLGPCTIGADAVVSAGAVVTGDVPAATVVAGNPALPVRSIDGGPPGSIDVPTRAGDLYLHAHDEVITPDLQRAGAMPDPDLELLASLAQGTVVDVGANVGYAALTAARTADRVIAVEPHPDNLRLLRANLDRNGAGNVTVVAAAAWDGPGEIALAECATNTGDHRTGTHIAGREHLRVPAVRLDDVVPATADVRLVKLDTQATEHVALRGAAALLERCRPVLLAEFWPQGLRERGDDPLAVLAAYAALGYRRSVVEEPAWGGLGDAELAERVHARPAPFGGFVTLRLDRAA